MGSDDLGWSRPSEALPEGKYKSGERKCSIFCDDVQFTHAADGRVVEAIAYIQPIKQHDEKVGNIDKVPIIIAAGREGSLRTVGLLGILFRLACADERGGQTPAFKYPAELVEMTTAKRKEHLCITQDPAAPCLYRRAFTRRRRQALRRVQLRRAVRRQPAPRDPHYDPGE